MFNANVLEACRLNKVQKIVYTTVIGLEEEGMEIGQIIVIVDRRPMELRDIGVGSDSVKIQGLLTLEDILEYRKRMNKN